MYTLLTFILPRKIIEEVSPFTMVLVVEQNNNNNNVLMLKVKIKYKQAMGTLKQRNKYSRIK